MPVRQRFEPDWTTNQCANQWSAPALSLVSVYQRCVSRGDNATHTVSPVDIQADSPDMHRPHESQKPSKECSEALNHSAPYPGTLCAWRSSEDVHGTGIEVEGTQHFLLADQSCCSACVCERWQDSGEKLVDVGEIIRIDYVGLFCMLIAANFSAVW